MSDDCIVTAYVVLDETLRALGHRSHALARTSDAAVLAVAAVAARYFQHHHERALGVLRLGGYLSGPLSASRLNRRRHALADRLGLAVATPGARFATGTAVLLDGMPVPVRRQARAVLRLAAAPGLHHRGPPGGLRPAAGRAARPHAGPRTGLRPARRGGDLRG